MALDRHAVLDRIQAILDAHQTPKFTVVPGEPIGPLGADGSPFCCFWIDGDDDPPEGGRTFTTLFHHYRFVVWCLWYRTPEVSLLENLEDEIFDAMVTLPAAFWADSQLDGLCTDLDVTRPRVGYEPFPYRGADGVGRTVFYRSVAFEINVKDLEGETIAA